VELEANLPGIISLEYGTDWADNSATLVRGKRQSLLWSLPQTVLLAGGGHSFDRTDVDL